VIPFFVVHVGMGVTAAILAAINAFPFF